MKWNPLAFYTGGWFQLIPFQIYDDVLILMCRVILWAFYYPLNSNRLPISSLQWWKWILSSTKKDPAHCWVEQLWRAFVVKEVIHEYVSTQVSTLSLAEALVSLSFGTCIMANYSQTRRLCRWKGCNLGTYYWLRQIWNSILKALQKVNKKKIMLWRITQPEL